MYFIIFKKGLNAEKSKIELDQPLTFTLADEMLLEAVTRFKQSGLQMKIGYKIIDKETGENKFTSKINIDREIPSLFELIKKNSNAPKDVVDYVIKVEKKEIVEAEENFADKKLVEEKARLDLLKTEKTDILQQLRKDEKERQLRDLDHQNKLKEIQEEKMALEKSLKLKEKEDALKEAKRLEALKQLEEQKAIMQQQLEKKRIADRKKKEEHEQRLKEVEEEAKKTEIELASVAAEIEKQELLRKKVLQELEEKKKEAARQASLLKAESKIEEIKHKKEMTDRTEIEAVPVPVIQPQSDYQVPAVELSLKDKLQGLDFEAVKSRSAQLVKISAKGSVKGGKKAYTMAKNYHSKRVTAKQQKLEALTKKIEVDEKLAMEKIKFLEELKKDQAIHERKLKKEAALKLKEEQMQIKIENRYRAAKKKRLGRYPFYRSNSFKTVIGLAIVVIGTLGSIHYFDLDNKFPQLEIVMSYIDTFIGEIAELFRS